MREASSKDTIEGAKLAERLMCIKPWVSFHPIDHACTHTGTFSTQEIEAELSEVHGQLQLHHEFEDSLEYCLRRKKKNKVTN